MELVPIKIEHGEDKAWQDLCGLPTPELCERTGVIFDFDKGAYLLKCFGIDFFVNPCEMTIESSDISDKSHLFLNKLESFFKIAVLRYLSSAKNIPPSGRLIRPVDVKGGHRFSAGTHVLPLDAIAEKYGKDRAGFIRKGLDYGAQEINGYGDAYIKLYPFPRVPVDMILWLEDEEFSPKVDLFFDSTCELQLTLSDVVWAVALMCCVVMLE